MAKIYGVFLGLGRDKDWAMTRNKKQALKEAKARNGFVRSLTDVPEISAYDRPTFFQLSEPVADFRRGSKPKPEPKPLRFKPSSTRISQRSLDRA